MSDNTTRQKLNIDTILPFGDNLRPLLASSSALTDSDLKSFLAMKGIYISSTDKEKTIPLITMSLLSPPEFEELREKQKDKESTVKRRNRELEWITNDSLFAALKNTDLPIKNMVSKNSNYEIRNIGTLKPVNGDFNHLSVEYEIERTDRTKDWVTQHSNHKGQIELKLSDDKKRLKVAMEHTADETHEVNEKCMKHLREHLLLNNYISNKKVQSIAFSDFDNSKRVKFFLNLLNSQLDHSGTFEFSQITNVEISIDTEATLPDKIKWMEDKIENMKLKGKAIHETDLLKDPQYHQALILSAVRANYNFKSIASKGSCTFEFGFPSRGNIPNANTEFVYKLLNFNFESDTKSKQKVQGFLYAKFDDFKTNAFSISIE
ncbi:hypothetical protein [Paenibacillus alvei]|uniref:GapS4b family protein n=1 Tax=Paenibacillus alvei TaxID=44250 RepID=UPI00228098DB|nr:hypothetical protein [Paenibacillus alvei]